MDGSLNDVLSTVVCLFSVTARHHSHWSAPTFSIYWTINGRTMTVHSSQTSNCQSSSYRLLSVSTVVQFLNRGLGVKTECICGL